MKKIFIFLLSAFLAFTGYFFVTIFTLQLVPASDPIRLTSLTDPVRIPLSSRPLYPTAVRLTLTPALPGSRSYDAVSRSLIYTPDAGTVYKYGQLYLAEVRYFGRLVGGISVVGPNQPAIPALLDNDLTIALNYPLAAYLPYSEGNLLADYVGPKKLRLRTSLGRDAAVSLITRHAVSQGVDLAGHEFVLEPLP